MKTKKTCHPWDIIEVNRKPSSLPSVREQKGRVRDARGGEMEIEKELDIRRQRHKKTERKNRFSTS